MLDEETPNTSNGTDGLNSELEASSAVANVIKEVEKSYDSGNKLLEESKNADEELGEEGAIYRDGDPDAHEREIARWRYEERVESGWYQIKKREKFSLFFVALEGFEPSQAEPESDVLPLHHWTIFDVNLTSTLVFDVAKLDIFFDVAKFCTIYLLKLACNV